MQSSCQSYYFELVESPVIDFAGDFCAELREPGLSGFMRLRNEADFLRIVVLSWIGVLDELVLVFNNCQDATEAIARSLARQFPEKIKIYHYLPRVYPQGAGENLCLAESSPHSLVHYYNFALSRTTKRWAIKVDGDLWIPNLEVAKRLRACYEWMSVHSPNEYLPVYGVNLINHLQGFYVPANAKYSGFGGDLCMFRVDTDTIFVKNGTLERLDLAARRLSELRRLLVYYHLKFVKRDFGLDNYDFMRNPDSHYIEQNVSFLINLQLVPLVAFLNRYKLELPLVSPEQLGISSSRNWRQTYKNALLARINASRKHNNLPHISAYSLGLYVLSYPRFRKVWQSLCEQILRSRIGSKLRRMLRPYWLKIKRLIKT